MASTFGEYLKGIESNPEPSAKTGSFGDYLKNNEATINDSMSQSPTTGTLGTYGQTLGQAVKGIPASVASMVEGSTPYTENNFLDKIQADDQASQQEFVNRPGRDAPALWDLANQGEIREAAPSLSGSGVAMAPMLAGAGIGGAIGGPVGALAGGVIGTGLGLYGMYRQGENQFVKQAIDQENANRANQSLPPLTQQEAIAKQDQINASGDTAKSGLAQSLPEMVGNAAELGIAMTPIGKAGGIVSKLIPKNVLGRAAAVGGAKLAAVMGTELGEEEITRRFQNPINERNNLPTQSFEDIAKPTLIATAPFGALAGGAGVYHGIKGPMDNAASVAPVIEPTQTEATVEPPETAATTETPVSNTDAPVEVNPSAVAPSNTVNPNAVNTANTVNSTEPESPVDNQFDLVGEKSKALAYANQIKDDRRLVDDTTGKIYTANGYIWGKVINANIPFDQALDEFNTEYARQSQSTPASPGADNQRTEPSAGQARTEIPGAQEGSEVTQGTIDPALAFAKDTVSGIRQSLSNSGAVGMTAVTAKLRKAAKDIGVYNKSHSPDEMLSAVERKIAELDAKTTGENNGQIAGTDQGATGTGIGTADVTNLNARLPEIDGADNGTAIPPIVNADRRVDGDSESGDGRGFSGELPGGIDGTGGISDSAFGDNGAIREDDVLRPGVELSDELTSPVDAAQQSQQEINDEKAIKETPNAGQERLLGTFKTSKGSVYQVHGDGTTSRDKAARNDPGHEGDSGKKARSVKTIYIDNAGWGLAPGLDFRVVDLGNNKASLVWRNKDGQFGGVEDTLNIPYSTTPKVGLHPIELWNEQDHVDNRPLSPGVRVFKKMHPGNPITEYLENKRNEDKTGTNDTQKATNPTPQAESALPVTGADTVRADAISQKEKAESIDEDHETNFRLNSSEIRQELIKRGDIKKLFKAAKVNNSDSFSKLPIRDQAKAYSSFISSGNSPVKVSQNYNDKVVKAEHDAIVRKKQSESVIKADNGKPFKTPLAVKQHQDKYDLGISHDVYPVKAGFVLKRSPETIQEEKRRALSGKESYIEAQNAIIKQLGIKENSDGDLDVSDAEFEELQKLVKARLQSQDNSNSVEIDGIKPQEQYVSTTIPKQPITQEAKQPDEQMAIPANSDEAIGQPGEAVYGKGEVQSKPKGPDIDAAYHYTNGNLGMTSNGSFTKDKSRWMSFNHDEATKFSESGVKPYGSKKAGIFTNTNTGESFKPNVKEAQQAEATPETEASKQKVAINENAEIEPVQSKSTTDTSRTPAADVDSAGGQEVLGEEVVTNDRNESRFSAGAVTKILNATSGRYKDVSLDTHDVIKDGDKFKIVKQSDKVGFIGDGMRGGETTLTKTGRRTSPFPYISQKEKVINIVKKSTIWLMENAFNEAIANKNENLARSFEYDLNKAKTNKPKINNTRLWEVIPRASKDLAEQYLFINKPDIDTKITNPLVSNSIAQIPEKQPEPEIKQEDTVAQKVAESNETPIESESKELDNSPLSIFTQMEEAKKLPRKEVIAAEKTAQERMDASPMADKLNYIHKNYYSLVQELIDRKDDPVKLTNCKTL